MARSWLSAAGPGCGLGPGVAEDDLGVPGGDPDQDDAAAAAQPDGELPDPLLVASVVVADDVDDGDAVGGLQDGAGRRYRQGLAVLLGWPSAADGGVAWVPSIAALLWAIHAACGPETRCVRCGSQVSSQDFSEHWTTSRCLLSPVAAATARARRGTGHDGHMIRISGRRVRLRLRAVTVPSP